jgi:hypothetical protein
MKIGLFGMVGSWKLRSVDKARNLYSGEFQVSLSNSGVDKLVKILIAFGGINPKIARFPARITSGPVTVLI